MNDDDDAFHTDSLISQKKKKMGTRYRKKWCSKTERKLLVAGKRRERKKESTGPKMKRLEKKKRCESDR